AFKLASSQSLEVEIKRGQHLNEVFAMLSQQGIQVLSMRNKTNRLEELFVRLVEKNLNEGASA
ncbi:MAG: ABC transporter, partial [Acinetobacter sp.]|nr:ABC transporter [Acinetobacter sp.]